MLLAAHDMTGAKILVFAAAGIILISGPASRINADFYGSKLGIDPERLVRLTRWPTRIGAGLLLLAGVAFLIWS